MIDKLIKLINENNYADAAKVLNDISYEDLRTFTSEQKIELLKVIFQKDLFNLYSSLIKKTGWNHNLESLNEEGSENLLKLLPERSQLAGYLFFQAIPIDWPIDQLIANTDKILKILYSKIIHPNIHEQAYETPLLSYLMTKGANLTDFEYFLFELIQKGALLSEKDMYNVSPLHIAAEYDKLIYFKPDPTISNIQDLWGNTPLHKAIKAGKLDAIKKLVLDWNADVNLPNTINITPLMLAAALGQKEIVEFLLQNKADINSVDIFGSSAMDWAKGLSHAEIIDLLNKNNSHQPHSDEFIQHNLVKAAYVESISDVSHMGRDSNALLSSFKQGNIFVVNSNQDLSLLLKLIEMKANENASKDYTCAIQINDEFSAHFSVAHLEIRNGNARSLIVDTLSDHSGVGAYQARFKSMFPQGRLLISTTGPQHSRTTCRVFTQDIGEKMIKYGVDYDDLENHIKFQSETDIHEAYLKKEALPLILGSRTIESISLLNQAVSYRKMVNDKEILINKKGASLIDIELRDIYGVQKKKNVFSRKKFEKQYHKIINKLKNLDMPKLQAGVLKSFGFFMLQPGLFDMKCQFENEKVNIIINNVKHYGQLEELINRIIIELNNEFPDDKIELTDEAVEKSADIILFFPKIVASKAALERFINHFEDSLKSVHFLDKNDVHTGKKEKDNVKTRAPLSGEAFLRDIKLAYSLLENPKLQI